MAVARGIRSRLGERKEGIDLPKIYGVLTRTVTSYVEFDYSCRELVKVDVAKIGPAKHLLRIALFCENPQKTWFCEV